jgi:rhodanese-related sulfurtransferase
MRTKKGFLLILSLLLLSLLMSACGAAEATQVPEETAPPVEETAVPTAEPTEEPTPEFTEEYLDAAAAGFLAEMEEYNTITPQAVNEALADGQDIFLIDVRDASELEATGYIEGAVNIPLRELAKNLDKLPAPDAQIITYCAKGTRGVMAMTALGVMGFTNVRAMVGDSFSGWVAAGFPVVEGVPPAPEVLDAVEVHPDLVTMVDDFLSNLPEEFAQVEPAALNEELAEGAEIVFVDVRNPSELDASGAIEGAINIPLADLITRKAEWPDIDAQIIIYCAKGTRGNIAMSILRTYGYQNIRNIKGGLAAWDTAGLPTVGGMKNAVADFLAGMQSYNTVTPQAVNEALADGQEFFLLDVRDVSELETAGYIEGAVNIPLRQLSQNIDKLPAFDTPIITYCAKGTRGLIAMTALGELGFTNVRVMVGDSFTGWVEAGFPVVEGVPAAPEALNAVEPSPAMLAAVEAMLTALPENYAQVEPAALNEELADGAEIVLLDVRRADELASGTLEDSINIPLEELITRKAEWPATDATIVVYCAKGVRGNIAMTILRTFGYQNVRSIKGGLDAWVAAGLPLAGN